MITNQFLIKSIVIERSVVGSLQAKFSQIYAVAFPSIVVWNSVHGARVERTEFLFDISLKRMILFGS